MNQDILLSKIVANTTDSTWSQAYTTLNVYMTISIENESSKTPVTSYGKEILEKLQREFFALDQKSLDQIKKAVENVTTTIEKDYKYSIIIGAIVKNILYIVIASKGKVIIKRGNKIGTIAEGEEGELIGFSGKLKHNDIVIFETRDFSEKLGQEKISEHLESNDVSQIAENITPLIHGESKGTEAAIIIQFKDLTGDLVKGSSGNDMEISELPEDDETNKREEENLKTETKEEEVEVTNEENMGEKLWSNQSRENNNIEHLEETDDSKYENEEFESPKKRFSLPIPQLNFSKRTLIGFLIVILVFILVGGIFYQKIQSDSKKRAAEFEKIYSPLEKEYSDAKETTSLNKSQAVEALKSILDNINKALPKFDKNSDEYKKLIELKENIDSQIKDIGGGGSVENLKEFYKANSDLASIDFVTLKGSDILVGSSKDKKIAIIEDGKIKKDFEVEDSIKFISADDRFIYSLGDKGISQIDRGNGKSKIVAKDDEGLAFEVYASNIYLLLDDDIMRFKSPSFTGASYFPDTTDFANNPKDMSISGSIFVLEDNGKIEKFTKGKKDDFELSGLAAPFAGGSHIYTDGDFENFYVMDVKNQRVVAFNNDGEFQNQYEGDFLKNAKSFAIDEKNKTGYVVSGNTLFSFDL